LVLALALAGAALGAAQDEQRFAFRTGVALVNVAVTVTDADGRFVGGLASDDFALFENGRPQTIAQFDAERVPVSLGIALDTSGSMYGDKILAAQAALNRFLFDLLGPDDEVFLYRFSGRPELVQGWTRDRRAVSRALGSVKPEGGTALYDTVAEAVPLAARGAHRKTALVIISDGNDTASRLQESDMAPLIRQHEALIYAVGIDASNGPVAPAPQRTPAVPSPFPSRSPAYVPPPQPRAPQPGVPVDRINAAALRAITDDSGGRTEIIVSHHDLGPATAGIADELSRQYFLGYVSTEPKDGQWHTIDVQVRGRGQYIVRARRGYVATP
jgi:VWFA-related protein